MSVYDQPKSTYSDTGPDIRVISDVVKMIDPRDTPLIIALGGLDSASSKFRINRNGTKIEWLEDALSSLTTTADDTTTIATNSTSFAVTDASLFKDGDVIKVDSEYMVVSASDATNNTISIYSRSYGGTNATHASTSAIEIVGQARLEGDDADYRGIAQLSVPYNYTAIFQEGLKITGTQEVISQYGIADQWEYQAMKEIPSLMRLIEKSVFQGIRAAGTVSAPRSFGGLATFVTTNTTSTTGKVNKTMVDDLAESIYGYGGNPDLFVVHPSSARDLRDVYDSSSFVNVTLQNTEFGMLPITSVNTGWGSLQLVQSRFCPTGRAYMLDSKRVGMYTLRPFGWREVARSGDSRKGEVIGEFSLVVANDAAHGYMSGIVT
jgi:hypothetical protein